MSLIATMIRRPIGTLITCLGVAVLGVVAFMHMPVHLRPRVQFPVLNIVTRLADTNTHEIELLLTKRIEEAIADVAGIRKIESISRTGESQITVQFHLGRGVTESVLEIRNRLRRLWPTFPPDTKFPLMTRYHPSDAPMVVLGVSGKTSIEETGEWVERFLKPQLSRLDGVATVTVSGAPLPEITVDCDVQAIRALNLTVEDVAQAIHTGHRTLPAGFLTTEGKRIGVRTTGFLKGPEDIASQPVRVSTQGMAVTVGNLARVERKVADPEEVTRYNGKSLVTVAVYRAGEADIRGTWRSVREKLQEIEATSDNVPHIEVIFNQAEELESILRRLAAIVPITLFVTGVTLFLFLGSVSSTVIVLAAIPLSLCLALLFLHILGIGLDLLALSGLTLALGILVDNAIVVIESIARRRDEGAPLQDAIVSGAEEVAGPLVLATLAAVIAFVPVVFLSKEIRLFFVSFAWAVSVGLAASLISSLVLIPVLFRYMGSRRSRPILMSFESSGFALWYDRAFQQAVGHRGLVLLVAACFLLVCLGLAQTLSFRKTAGGSVQQFRIILITQPGAAKEHTDVIAQEVERQVLTIPGVERVHSDVKGNHGILNVSMQFTKEDSGTAVQKVLDHALAGRKDVQSHLMETGSQGEGRKISLDVHGPGPEQLVALQPSLRSLLEGVAGVRDVIIHQANPVPVVGFLVQHADVGFSRVHARSFAYQLRGHLQGPISARIPEGERTVDVRVRALREVKAGLGPLSRTVIRNERGELIPLTELVEPAARMEPVDLHRENRRPVMNLSLLLDKDEPLVIAAKVKEAFERHPLPPGYDYSFGDEVRDIIRMRKEMVAAAGIGLILIYLILVAATESLLLPFIIMIAVPFALGGVVMALRIAGVPVALPTYVGMIILCGLAINVNIVMVHAMKRRREAGDLPKDAARAGAHRRLRPILMTVVTTVCGSLPMLFDTGRGSSLWSPLALSLAAGMTASAIFSLVMTPTMYTALEELKARIWKPMGTL